MKSLADVPKGEMRRDYRLRLDPDLLHRIKAYALSHGHGARWSSALEADILVPAINALKRRPSMSHLRQEAAPSRRVSGTATRREQFMMAYHYQAVRIGYRHYSDLISEVAEHFFTDQEGQARDEAESGSKLHHLNLPPQTITWLRSYATKNGFGRRWGMALEAILGPALSHLDRRQPGTKAPKRPAPSRVTRALQASLTQTLLVEYLNQAKRLRYTN